MDSAIDNFDVATSVFLFLVFRRLRFASTCIINNLYNFEIYSIPSTSVLYRFLMFNNGISSLIII